jgi:hypothetical protein
MAETLRTYSKSNPEKELLPPQVLMPIDAESVGVSSIKNLADGFQKQDLEIMPKAFFILISGGEAREKDYFRIISSHDKFERIKIDFIADPLKLSPCGMFEVAQYKKARYNSSKNTDAEPDRIYLISDVDHYIAELLQIRPKCIKEGFSLIISNSCFEVWLYYAYCDSLPNFTIPSNYLTISSKFEGWLLRAIRGGVKTTRAILSIGQNIEHAKKNYKEDINGIPELFSTNMFELAQDLLPLIEPELTALIEENKMNEAKYRRKGNKSNTAQS